MSKSSINSMLCGNIRKLSSLQQEKVSDVKASLGKGTRRAKTSRIVPIQLNRNMDIKIPQCNVFDCISPMKENSRSKFIESIEVAVKLGVDPRKPNQSIKSTARLPFGSGKVVRVGVFASGDDAQAALDAGADVVGAEDLIKSIQGGEINFDRVISTPEMMVQVAKIGKVNLMNIL